MKKITNDVTALIIARITGSITQQEEMLLDKLLEKFPQVKALSDFLNEPAPPVEIQDRATLEQEARNIIKMADSDAPMVPEPPPEPKKLNRLLPIAAAACLVAVIILTVKLGGNYTPRQQSANAENKDSTSTSLVTNNDRVLLPGKKLTIHPVKGLLIDDANVLRTLKDSEKDVMATLTVPPGRVYTLELSDGSKVAVNSATTIKFPLQFKEQQREVTVDGEAYFTVHANANRPFIVHLPHTDVIALGTQFNVKSYNERAPRIALVSGSAKITSGTHTTELKPGQMVTHIGNRPEVVPIDKDETSWLHGEIYLYNVSEIDIPELTWRYWRKKLTIERPLKDNVTDLIINRREPIDSFLVQLAPLNRIFPDGNGYRIKR